MSHEISFAYIKSEGIDTTCEEDIYSEIVARELEIIQVKDIFMNYIKLREHQPILFDLKGDLNDIWKIQGAARLIGTTVRTALVQGDDAIQRTFDTKVDIRERYALPKEFDRDAEMSYPNYMHAADNKAQVQNDVKILLPDSLEQVMLINGDHQMTTAVW
jgi:hypothetical protein